MTMHEGTSLVKPSADLKAEVPATSLMIAAER